MSEAQIGFAKSLDKVKEEAKVRGLNREARESLQDILKVKGIHQEAAKALLVDLGVDASSNVAEEKLPEPKDFEEALSQGRMRVSRAEDGKQAIEILRQQGSSEEDIQSASAQIQQARLQGIDRLTKAISLYKDTKPKRRSLGRKVLVVVPLLQHQSVLGMRGSLRVNCPHRSWNRESGTMRNVRTRLDEQID